MDPRVKYIIGLLGVSIVVFCVWYFRSIIAYILIAAAVSILGHPIIYLLERIRFKGRNMPRGLSAGLALVLLWFVIILFFRIFIPLIVIEANVLSTINVQLFYESFEQPFRELQRVFQHLGYFEKEIEFKEFIVSNIVSVLDTDYLSAIFSGVTSMLGNLVIAFFAISFISFFFLKDATLLSTGILVFIPDRHVNEMKHALSSIKNLLTRYLGGIFIEVILVMLLITFGLWLVGIGIQHALICGLFAGVLNVIPYVGPWIGALFSILIGIATNLDLPFQSELVPLILFMVLVFAIVQTIDNVLFQPLIYSNSVNAHPLEIFLVIMMAASMAGVGGMILAIPSYTVMRVIAKEFLSGFKVVQKLTQNI